MRYGSIKVILENLDTLFTLKFNYRHLNSKTRYAVNLTHTSATLHLPTKLATAIWTHSLWIMPCMYKTPEDLWN